MSAAEAAGPPYSRSSNPQNNRTAAAEAAAQPYSRSGDRLRQKINAAGETATAGDSIDAADIADDAVGAAEGRQVAVSADEHDVAEGARFAA